MNDDISYAEMLEIPVETVTVSKKEKRKKWKEEPLSDRVVKEVNDRMETSDPAYAESKPIEREYIERPKKSSNARKILIAELVAVVALCATIFLTNLLLPNSAINTAVKGLFRGKAAEATDSRTYADFTLSPIVSGDSNAEVTVSESGLLSFTASAVVYVPAEGKLESKTGNPTTGYTVRIRHSASFSTIISGLDDVGHEVGSTVRPGVPFGYTDGEGAVNVIFYDGENVIQNVALTEGNIAWS